MTIRDISKLSPRMQQKWAELVEVLKSKGIHVKVTETLRDSDRQAQLLKTGASKVKRSKHQDGDAVDVCLDTSPHRDISGPWDTTTSRGRELWFLYGEAAESVGLRWGGRFNKGGDLPSGQRHTLGWDAGHIEFKD